MTEADYVYLLINLIIILYVMLAKLLQVAHKNHAIFRRTIYRLDFLTKNRSIGTSVTLENF